MLSRRNRLQPLLVMIVFCGMLAIPNGIGRDRLFAQATNLTTMNDASITAYRWQAMARFYGCSQPNISKEARRRGHDKRVQYPGRPVLTLAGFRELELARAMARSAAETGAALRHGGMVDAPTRAWKGAA